VLGLPEGLFDGDADVESPLQLLRERTNHDDPQEADGERDQNGTEGAASVTSCGRNHFGFQDPGCVESFSEERR
jgi:hypothetical protein